MTTVQCRNLKCLPRRESLVHIKSNCSLPKPIVSLFFGFRDERTTTKEHSSCKFKSPRSTRMKDVRLFGKWLASFTTLVFYTNVKGWPSLSLCPPPFNSFCLLSIQSILILASIGNRMRNEDPHLDGNKSRAGHCTAMRAIQRPSPDESRTFHRFYYPALLFRQR